MFKIPITYYIDRMVSSKSPSEWLHNYNGCIQLINFRNQYFLQEWKQFWIKLIKA